MMLNHNKKRNVGLLNEFFARHIANLLVSQKHDAIDRATKLYGKYFTGNTQIAKEWKLFQGLYTTNISSNEVAHSLLSKVRDLTLKESATQKLLEDEKTKLIHEINNSLGDKDFFSRAVPDYKIQASIQVLLNTWRTSSLNESSNLSNVAHLEDSLLEHLTKKKIVSEGNSSYLDMNNEEIDGLVVQIMSEKFNNKFSEQLNDEQRSIISSYVFQSQPEVRAKLVEQLEGIRSRTLNLVETTLTTKKSGSEVIGESVAKKLTGIKNMLLNEYKDTSKVSDETVTFYMTVIKLEKELLAS